MDSVLVVISESAEQRIKNAKYKKDVFPGTRPYVVAVVFKHIINQHTYVYECVPCGTFYWPRLRPSYPISAKKSPNFGLCMYVSKNTIVTTNKQCFFLRHFLVAVVCCLHVHLVADVCLPMLNGSLPFYCFPFLPLLGV